MLQRRVDALTKERMWGGLGGGGWGDASRGGWGHLGGWGDGGWGQASYARMEELAVETERQCAEELIELADWRSLELMKPPSATWSDAPTTYIFPTGRGNGRCSSVGSDASGRAGSAAGSGAGSGPGIGPGGGAGAETGVPVGGMTTSDHSCASRTMRPVESCPELTFSSSCAAYNTSCPISLTDFEEGEKVRRLPGGHLIAVEAFEQLLDAARREEKPPTCPFTRQEFGPGVTASQLQSFCTVPLDVLNLSRVVARVPLAVSAALRDASTRLGARQQQDTSELHSGAAIDVHASAQHGAAIGFDVSAHPDARSKVARDMQERLKMDAEEHARQLAIATAPRCLFVMDADELVRTGGGSGGGGGGGSGGAGGPLLADVAKCKAAEEALGALMADLIRQRDRDAAYVREALPQLMKRANSVEVDLKSLQPHERRERELFVLRQVAEQEPTAALDFLFCLLISARSAEDVRMANPFLVSEEVEQLFDLVVASILHASRVGQINRCLSEAHGLLRLLRPPLPGPSFGTTETALREVRDCTRWPP